MNYRLKLFTLLFAISFVLLFTRLFFWQVIKGEGLAAEARSQYQQTKVLSAPRGNILAKDNSYLVSGQEAFLVYSYLPDIEENTSDIADKLAAVFVDEDGFEENYKEILLSESNKIKQLLTREDVSWVPLKQKVNRKLKEQIESLQISGIGFEKQEKRAYPEASSAAHLLGFVGKSSEGVDEGYFGLEGYYDLTLTGKPGYSSRESDASGIPILFGSLREVSAIGGIDLVTYIDKAIQLSVERELKNGIEKYGASSGTVIVMDPKTGGILAQSSFPSYDPSEYQKYSDDLFRNPAISESFEPGSVFKVLVMASALDAGAVDPDTKCEVCLGPLPVDKYTIETWNNVYRADSNMVDVIVHSDNVGMAWVAQKLGADRMYDYLSDFGIGQPTGVDLQGEWSPLLREKGTWNIVDLSTAGFGQGVAVTPIQMVRAVAAVANHGILVTPKVVDKIEAAGWEEELGKGSEKRVISEKASNQITSMMVEAAKNGESKWTYLKGFNVAGKTGTAQIPIAGHYDDEKTIASFVGFAPADNPKFVMLVTLKEPTSSPWASETAAPLWYLIARDLFLHFGIQPKY